MGRFGSIAAAALAAFALSPAASAKEFRSLAVVGADGDSLEFHRTDGLIESFFDGASRFNRGRVAKRRPARGGYLRLYPLGASGHVGIAGRFYPDSRAACFDWLQWRRPRDCYHPNDALLHLLAPARRLIRFHGRPTTVGDLWQPRLRGALRRQLRVAFELAFDRSRLARGTSRPSRCISFSARWSGPDARSRPRSFCLAPAGAYARGRLYPLGRAVWSLVELNLDPPSRRPASANTLRGGAGSRPGRLRQAMNRRSSGSRRSDRRISPCGPLVPGTYLARTRYKGTTGPADGHSVLRLQLEGLAIRFGERTFTRG